MTHIERIQRGRGREERVGTTHNEVQLSIQTALSEAGILERLVRLETEMEHRATKEYVSDVIPKGVAALKDDIKWFFWILVFIGATAIALMAKMIFAD